MYYARINNNYMAERVGFEPTLGFPKHAFQACAFSRSAISPYYSYYCKLKIVRIKFSLYFLQSYMHGGEGGI